MTVDKNAAQKYLDSVILYQLINYPEEFCGDYWSGTHGFDINVFSHQPDESSTGKWEIMAVAYPIVNGITNTRADVVELDTTRFYWLRATDDQTYGLNLRKD